MRLIRSFQLLEAARVLIVVIGLLSVVSMMGAAPKHPKRVSVRAVVQNPQARIQPQHLPVFKNIELLHDVSDMSARTVRQDEPGVRKVSMEVTAYCACSKCCGPNAAGITASGHYTTYNNSQFAAADPSLPFGTKLLIPGYSEKAVEVIDRGSAIRGDKLDVFFPSHDAALEWGRQRVDVTILQ